VCFPLRRRSHRWKGGVTVAQTIRGMRQQLANELIHRRLVTDVRWASGNRRNHALVRAILAAGMYPQMGAMLPPAIGQQATAKPTIQHPSGQKVRIYVGYARSSFCIRKSCLALAQLGCILSATPPL
jgi:hypothetical protein